MMKSVFSQNAQMLLSVLNDDSLVQTPKTSLHTLLNAPKPERTQIQAPALQLPADPLSAPT